MPKDGGDVTEVGSDVSAATRATAADAVLPYLRPNQVKGSFVYRQPLGGLSDVRGFGGSVLLASATYAFEEGGVRNLDNSAARSQDTVRRLNAHVGLETDNWSLFVRGENLTDHSYETWDNTTTYLRNPPRYVYGEFTYRF